MKRMSRVLVFVALLGLCAPLFADVKYSISFTNPGPQIDPFSFSFVVPAFLTTDGPFTIPPFSVIAGGDTWTFTKAYASVATDGLNPLVHALEFGTPPASVGHGGVSIFPAGGGMVLDFGFDPFPDTEGSFHPGDVSLFVSNGVVYENFGSSPDTTVDITSTPEPGSVLLLLSTVVLVPIARRLRRQ